MNEAFDPRTSYAFLEDGGGLIAFPDTSTFWQQLMGGVYTEELMRRYIGLGMRMVLAGSDMSLLSAASAQRAGLLRSCL